MIQVIKEGFKNSLIITVFSFMLIVAMHMHNEVPILNQIMN